jgi:hypothetical protein
MKTPETGKTYVQRLQTSGYLFLAGPLLFFIFIYLHSSTDQLYPTIEPDYALHVFLPTIVAAGISVYIGLATYNRQKADAAKTQNFQLKLKAYEKASRVRFLAFGIATALVTLGFYLTNYQPFAALFGMMIVLFSIHNPSPRRVVQALRLQGDEKSIIIDGLEIHE